MRNFERFRQELLDEIAKSEVLSAGVNEISEHPLGLECLHVVRCNGIDLHVMVVIREERLVHAQGDWARRHKMYVATTVADLILASKGGSE